MKYVGSTLIGKITASLGISLAVAAGTACRLPADDKAPVKFTVKPDLFQSLTEPPCSYCSTQHRKGLIGENDRVLAWIRANHNGGAISLRHFLAGPRVINDTYGLFFYDPDGGYVSAFTKDYGYRFYGWRNGVMVTQARDGSLFSALTGIAFDGPRKGKKLERIPSLVTNWGHWLMLHPESTAYDLFDGKKYAVTELPVALSAEARDSMAAVDPRCEPMSTILGVESATETVAFAIDESVERDCVLGTVGDTPVAVFWYRPTRSAVAFSRLLDGRELTLYADEISPETAPFKDRETGTRWTLAGRGVDGPLRGKELNWVNSVQCRWYAWSSEYPSTRIHQRP